MRPRVVIGCLLLLFGIAATVRARQISSLDRERGALMLHGVRNDLEKRYYDSTFHGLNLAALFDSAEADVRSAQSNSDIFGIIAGVLVRLDDSHTWFLPPARVARVEYGWTMRIVGETAFVFTVTPGSDAQTSGLHVGDAILGVDRFRPTRRSFLKLLYWYYALSPQEALTLIARSPDSSAQPRRVVAHAKVIEGKPILDLSGQDGGTDFWNIVRQRENARHAWADRFAAVGRDVLVWRLKSFDSEDQMDQGIKRAAGFPTLVVDARNNPGGAERALLRLTGHLLSAVDTIGTVHRRHEAVPLVSKPSKPAYAGNVVVLVDAGSASASEVFARTMQLAHRGRVVGDTTAGAVMRNMGWGHTIGTEIAVFYGVSVTDADIVMSDGGRLEQVGVVPDLPVLPTGSDLAAGRDPALALAIGLGGPRIGADSAGRLFPREPDEH
jgi:C-terminal processing protease CtpA/Prc